MRRMICGFAITDIGKPMPGFASRWKAVQNGMKIADCCRRCGSVGADPALLSCDLGVFSRMGDMNLWTLRIPSWAAGVKTIHSVDANGERLCCSS